MNSRAMAIPAVALEVKKNNQMKLTAFSRCSQPRTITYRVLCMVLLAFSSSVLTAQKDARSPDDWGPHSMLGKLTVKEWGKLMQIHIDYHLRQFAA